MSITRQPALCFQHEVLRDGRLPARGDWYRRHRTREVMRGAIELTVTPGEVHSRSAPQRLRAHIVAVVHHVRLQARSRWRRLTSLQPTSGTRISDSSTRSWTEFRPSTIRIWPLPHPQRAKMLLRLVGVMRSTAELKIVCRRGASFGVRHDVVILQEPSFCAPADLAHERALPAIPSPHLSLDRRGYVARACRRGPLRPRTGCHGEFAFFEFSHQQCQRAIEDRGGIAVGIVCRERSCARRSFRRSHPTR